MLILDHMTLPITDLARGKEFYAAALAPLGIELVMEWGMGAGYGRGGKPSFWIAQQERLPTQVHLAFVAEDHAAVDAFHAAALAAGATDHGAPGPRPHYHPSYYGAFVLDPDGHNIEAVCHKPA